jgi:RNA polymerase sigma-32 factor
LREGRVTDFLTREAEQTLARRWRDQKDERAMHSMVRAHEPLARSITKRYNKFVGAILPEDLHSEAYIGLLEAAKRFDPDLGIRFSTYAQHWIRAAITDHIFKVSTIVRSPSHGKGKLAFWRGEKTIAVSMESRIAGEDNDLTLGDTFVSEGPLPDELAEESIDGQRLTEEIRRALSRLKDREREIIRARYLKEDSETLAVVAERFGISRERVRQIEVVALNRLRKYMGVEVMA